MFPGIRPVTMQPGGPTDTGGSIPAGQPTLPDGNPGGPPPNSGGIPPAGTPPPTITLPPGASWRDAGGQARTGDTAPAGTPFYRSATVTTDPTTGRPVSSGATSGNPLSGYVSPEGGKFGPAAGGRLDAKGIQGILGGNPGQYDALSTRLAGDPNLYHQWQGILQNDPAAINAAITSGDTDLAGIGQSYKDRLGSDSDFLAAHNWQNPFDAQTSTSPTAPPAGTSPAAPPDAPVGPAPDADPFGRFDSPSSPAHGVITPQYEQRLGDAATPLNPGIVPPSPGASQTTQTMNPFLPFGPQAPVFR